MSLEFNHTIIYSKHKEKLSSYLSELLEASIHKIHEGIEIKTKEFHLIICDEPDGLSDIRSCFKTAFHFYVSSRKELDEILQRVQFIWFRQGQKNEIPPVTEETSHGEERFLFKLQDKDGHRWIFSTPKENKNE